MKRNSSFQRSLEAMRAREREQEEKERRQRTSEQEEEDWDDEGYADEEPDEDDRYERNGFDGGDESWEEVPVPEEASHWGCMSTVIGIAVVILIIVLVSPVSFSSIDLGNIDTKLETLFGTRMSVDELAKDVKNDIVEYLKKDPYTRILHVKDVGLVHEDGNLYSGMITVELNQKEIISSIKVVYDGESCLWEITSDEIWEELEDTMEEEATRIWLDAIRQAFE